MNINIVRSDCIVSFVVVNGNCAQKQAANLADLAQLALKNLDVKTDSADPTHSAFYTRPRREVVSTIDRAAGKNISQLLDYVAFRTHGISRLPFLLESDAIRIVRTCYGDLGDVQINNIEFIQPPQGKTAGLSFNLQNIINSTTACTRVDDMLQAITTTLEIKQISDGLARDTSMAYFANFCKLANGNFSDLAEFLTTGTGFKDARSILTRSGIHDSYLSVEEFGYLTAFEKKEVDEAPKAAEVIKSDFNQETLDLAHEMFLECKRRPNPDVSIEGLQAMRAAIEICLKAFFALPTPTTKEQSQDFIKDLYAICGTQNQFVSLVAMEKAFLRAFPLLPTLNAYHFGPRETVVETPASAKSAEPYGRVPEEKAPEQGIREFARKEWDDLVKAGGDTPFGKYALSALTSLTAKAKELNVAADAQWKQLLKNVAAPEKQSEESVEAAPTAPAAEPESVQEAMWRTDIKNMYARLEDIVTDVFNARKIELKQGIRNRILAAQIDAAFHIDMELDLNGLTEPNDAVLAELSEVYRDSFVKIWDDGILVYHPELEDAGKFVQFRWLLKHDSVNYDLSSVNTYLKNKITSCGAQYPASITERLMELQVHAANDMAAYMRGIVGGKVSQLDIDDYYICYAQHAIHRLWADKHSTLVSLTGGAMHVDELVEAYYDAMIAAYKA